MKAQPKEVTVSRICSLSEGKGKPGCAHSREHCTLPQNPSLLSIPGLFGAESQLEDFSHKIRSCRPLKRWGYRGMPSLTGCQGEPSSNPAVTTMSITATWVLSPCCESQAALCLLHHTHHYVSWKGPEIPVIAGCRCEHLPASGRTAWE